MPAAGNTRINLNESQVHAEQTTLTAQMNVKLITEGWEHTDGFCPSLLMINQRNLTSKEI